MERRAQARVLEAGAGYFFGGFPGGGFPGAGAEGCGMGATGGRIGTAACDGA